MNYVVMQIVGKNAVKQITQPATATECRAFIKGKRKMFIARETESKGFGIVTRVP